MKRHQAVWLVAFALLVLAPLTAEAGGVLVHSALDSLCQMVNCLANIQHVPYISSISPVSQITPGGLVIIVGYHFASEKGKALLTGIWQEESIAQSSYPLEVTDWYDTFVVGRVPGGISKVRKQGAKLQIYSAQGDLGSNEYPVTFMPTLDYQVLPNADVTVVSCGDASDDAYCNKVIASCEGEFCGYCSSPSMCGRHENDWCCTGTVYGTDSFQLTLKNDWAFDHMDWAPDRSSDDVPYPNPPAGFPAGGSAWNPQIAWQTNNDDYVAYSVVVYIKGPKGVPWK